jgi:hypothetical protein
MITYFNFEIGSSKMTLKHPPLNPLPSPKVGALSKGGELSLISSPLEGED